MHENSYFFYQDVSKTSFNPLPTIPALRKQEQMKLINVHLKVNKRIG